jgi:dihydrofolate reductase
VGKVIAIEHLTLDGVMQAPARPDEDVRGGFDRGGWATARIDPTMMQVLGACMGEGWSLLVGRITYEDFASVWPQRPRPNPFADALDAVTKFVAATTLAEPLPWQNSRLLDRDGADAVATLKKEHDGNLVIFGSGVLVQSLMRRDLVDEFLLQIHPIVLGKGRRLFPDGGPPASFRLGETVATKTGVILATYRRA